MNVIGEASILVTADGSQFEEDLQGQTAEAFTGLEADATASGAAAGAGMRAGVKDGADGIASDISDAAGAGALALGDLDTAGKNVGDDIAKSAEKGGGGLMDSLGSALSFLTGGLVNLNSTGNSTLDNITGKMGTAGTATDGFAGKMGALGKVIAIGTTVAVLGFAAASIKLGMDFQTATTSLSANADISIAKAQGIGNALLDTAGTSIFSGNTMIEALSPVAAVFEEIAGHQLDAANSTLIMKTASDLAEASQVSLANATSDLAKIMQAYQLPLSAAATTSDILFEASRQTGVGLDQVTSSLQRARTQMGAAAPPLSALAGLLVDITNHGETGRGAISALGSAFSGIIAPTAAVTAAQQAANVSFLNAKGQLLPLTTIFAELQPVLAGMGTAEAAATLKTLGFGSASQKLAETIQAGPAVLQKYIDSVNKTNAAHEAAEKQAQTLDHQFDMLKATVEDYATKLGSVLLPAIRTFLDWLVKAGNYVMQHKELLIALAAVIGGILVTAIGFWIASMSVVVPIIGGIILAVAALAAGIDYLATHWQQVWSDIKHWFDDAVNDLRSGFGTLGIVLLAFLGPIGIVLAAVIEFALHWQQIWAVLDAAFQAVWSVIGGVVKDGVAVVVDNVTEAWGVVEAIFTTAWNVITGVFKTAWDLISTIVATVIGVIKGIIDAFIALVTGNWTAFGNALHSVISTAWDGIKSVFDDVTGFITGTLTAVVNGFKAVWSAVWNGASSVLSTVWGAVSGVFHDISSGITDGIKGALSTLGTVWSYVWSGIKTVLSTAWDGVKTIFDAIKDALDDIESVASKVAGAIGGILNAGKSVLSTVTFGLLAEGGLITKPTLALVGEAGPEVVLPLNNRARIVEILTSAGLSMPTTQTGPGPGGLAGIGSLGASSTTTVQSSVVTVAPGAVVIQVGDSATASQASMAAKQGLTALTQQIKTGQSPIRGGVSG